MTTVPKSGAHQRQRRKNFVLLAVLVGLVALFYTLTMVKISGL
jgi:hypothetical protein